MTRQYPQRPVFGVGAIIFKAAKVLLIRRGRAPLKGCWSLPGGAQELGETAKQALKREVLEETGLKIEVLKFISLVDLIDRDGDGKVRHHYTVADYLCRPAGGQLNPAGDAETAEWVAIDKLDSYRLTPRAKEVIEKAWHVLKNT